MNQSDHKNLLIASVLCVLILMAWSWFYEKPRSERIAAAKKITEQKNIATENSEQKPQINSANAIENNERKVILSLKNRSEILAQNKSSRIAIKSELLHGSISLKGARFDDLTLAKYFKAPKGQKGENEEVTLFSPSESKERYFSDFGWLSSDSKIETPKPDTLWKSNSKELTPQKPVTLSWQNNQGVEFLIEIELDEKYMFSVTQRVKNNSKQEISMAPYGRIDRVLNNLQKSNYILHEGPIGVFNGILHEVSYTNLAKEKQQEFLESAENDVSDNAANKANEGTGGWLGITDKYWLSSIIPDRSLGYQAKFNYEIKNQNNIFSSEFIGKEFKINAGEELEFKHHLFAGAKRVKLLDQYSKDFNIKFFDRAIDFGWFYFLTKPFFSIIEFLNRILGNFGLAILAMTVLVKLALFPMANKSYAAIAKVKKLQPKIDALRTRMKGDKLAINREMMELYKKENVNPAAGCLPILIQIPVFFALYKVLFVTLDMRHADFYGWINDLSAPDPTSIFNLFGLLPFELSKSFTIGVWPILMGITMVIQQKLNPPSADPTQKQILQWMPYVLTFVLATFPAGLVIYWTWSNVLSILQQMLINKKYTK